MEALEEQEQTPTRHKPEQAVEGVHQLVQQRTEQTEPLERTTLLVRVVLRLRVEETAQLVL